MSAGSPAARPTSHAFTVQEEVGERLDMLVARACGLSRTQSATLIANGHVLVNDRAERSSYRGEAGDQITVTVPPPPGRDILPEQIPLTIVFEDEHLLVVDKAAGMVVHPAPGNWTGTLVNALLGRGGPLSDTGTAERAGLVHRLDKDTSGLLLVAKTDTAHRLLSAALAARRVTRRYATVCWGHITGDTLSVDKPLGRDPRDRTRMAIVQTGKGARTDFVRLARFDSVDLLRAHLHSGRTHQIRVHLASVGHPVMGDDTYGGGGGRRLVALPPKRQFLHAAWLRFRHPMTGETMDLRSPLPTDLRESLVAVSGMTELATTQDPLDVFGFFNVDLAQDAGALAAPERSDDIDDVDEFDDDASA